MGDVKPRLLDQVRDQIRGKYYSIRTRQAYVDWVRGFMLHHNKRHPATWLLFVSLKGLRTPLTDPSTETSFAPSPTTLPAG